MANRWALPWQAKYKDKVAILDDSREGISLALMKNGIYDLNTDDRARSPRPGSRSQNLAQLTNVHIDNNDYTEVPGGQIWIHQAWSGDMAASPATCKGGPGRRRRLLVPVRRQGPDRQRHRSRC